MRFIERLGLWRSWLIYYGKPFNRSNLRRFYAKFVKNGDLVFDIGAHLGHRSQSLLDLGARVVAVEPQPNCLQFLKNKFGPNARFSLIEGILGAQPSVVPFKISSKTPTVSTARDLAWQQQINTYGAPATWDLTHMVPCFTLDQLIDKYGVPVFCKIDTEGFEWEVLSGLSKPIQNISLEYLAFDKDRTIRCLDKLETLGNYRCNFSPGESLIWLWSDWKSISEVKVLLEAGHLPHRFGDFYVSTSRTS